MKECDWSSDVCSSDLSRLLPRLPRLPQIARWLPAERAAVGLDRRERRLDAGEVLRRAARKSPQAISRRLIRAARLSRQLPRLRRAECADPRAQRRAERRESRQGG